MTDMMCFGGTYWAHDVDVDKDNDTSVSYQLDSGMAFLVQLMM
jgi:hypothetical protein